MHKMVFAEDFCVCEREDCKQTWRMVETRKQDEWGEKVFRRWEPIDPDYKYRGGKPNFRKKKRRR
jgi:hypothetical protein